MSAAVNFRRPSLAMREMVRRERPVRRMIWMWLQPAARSILTRSFFWGRAQEGMGKSLGKNRGNTGKKGQYLPNIYICPVHVKRSSRLSGKKSKKSFRAAQEY